MSFKIIILLISVLQILLNLIFIAPLNVKVIITGGGPMGIGLIVIPFTVPLSLLSIGAFIYSVATLKTMKRPQISLFLNGLAFILIFLFVTLIILQSEPSILEAIEHVWS